MSSDLSPLYGAKSAFDRKPSRAEINSMLRATEILRNRYVRWTTWHYTRILAGIRRDIVDLGHVPDETELATIMLPYEEQERSVLSRMFLNAYADQTDVSSGGKRRILRRQTKADGDDEDYSGLSLEQQRILQQIEESIGTSIREISETTLRRIQELYAMSTDTNDFMDRLMHDVGFSTSRAATIARTETQTACMVSKYREAGEYSFGRPMSVTWVTTSAEPRRWHAEMNDVTVMYGELFQVPRRRGGFDYMYCPGDRSHGASGENIINCRCDFYTLYLD